MFSWRGTRKAVLLVVVVVVSVFGPIFQSPSAIGGTKSQAGVVVVHGSSSEHVDCVAFKGDSINALDLLNRSDLSVLTSWITFTGGGAGRFICWLDGEGQGTGAASCTGTGSDPYWDVWTQKSTQAKPHESFVGVSELNIAPKTIMYLTYGTYPQTTPAAKVFGTDVCATP